MATSMRISTRELNSVARTAGQSAIFISRRVDISARPVSAVSEIIAT